MHSPFDKIDETPDEPFPNILSWATYVPERKKRYPVGMSHGSLVTSEEELDTFDDQEFLSEAERKSIIQNAFAQFDQKRPLSQPTSLTVGDLEGADGSVGQSIAGENTAAGMVAGWGVFGLDIASKVPTMTNLLGMLFGKPEDEESKSKEAKLRAAAQKDFVDEDTVAAREAALDVARSEADKAAEYQSQENPGYSTPSDTDTDADTDADADMGPEGGMLQAGGQIKGYQEGAMVEEQADTTMDAAGLGPMGLVDDMDGDQVTGVADDLNMETEEGAYVLNADAVELIGLKDLNKLVKDAIEIAVESDIPIPKQIDPTKKVPIKISNGEFVIPAILVPIIGLENLEKMNKRGLMYREKNREEGQASPPEAEQQNIPVEPSEVPSRGVPGEINI